MESSTISYTKTNTRENQLWKNYRKLSPADKAAIENLHGRDKHPLSRKNLREICDLNAFGTPHGGGEVYVEISRINHACDANSEFHYHWTRKAGTIHAVKDVEEGSEITISYSAHDNGNLRRKDLERYGFDCQCRLCQVPCTGPIDMMTRPQMREYILEQPAEDRILLLEMKLDLKDSLNSLSSVYYDLSAAYVELAEFTEARYWADKYLEDERMCRGNDDTVFQAQRMSAHSWKNRLARIEENYIRTLRTIS